MKFKFALVVILFVSGLFVFAQTVKDVSSSVGNGKEMEYNLNEPNATSPATNNNQKYDRGDNKPIVTSHPEKDLGNSYKTNTK